MSQQDFVSQQFGNRLRLRVSGICTEGNRLLLVKHRGLGALGELWIPPGGEVEWGQSVPENGKELTHFSFCPGQLGISAYICSR